jgi:hypothetical protein
LHYLSMIAEKAGIRWDQDCRAEVEEIVDLIVDAAVEEAILALKPSEEEQAGEGYAEYYYGLKPRGTGGTDL